MDIEAAIAWARTHRHAVLVTIRRDGRPQTSDVVYRCAPDGAFEISVTDDRAKTANMRRDNRVIVHITDPASWSYISVDGRADLSAVAADPHDQVADALVQYYEAVAGKPHDDWAAYRAAMVSERRLIASIRPMSVTGQVNT